ncbi:hypothetical protein FACS1894190_05030 [Spirochaetia bacterium]|nr:hypothetical protein FACS1894190_05030 [Spirochaetia bacterium]
MRIAIASTDGIIIDEHFGKSHWFYIVDMAADSGGEGGFTNIEKRYVTPACEGGTHSESGMGGVIKALADCEVILAAKAGPGAIQAAEAAGKKIFQNAAPIDDSLKKLAAYYGRSKK